MGQQYTLKNQIHNKLGLKRLVTEGMTLERKLKNQIHNKLGLKLNGFSSLFKFIDT